MGQGTTLPKQAACVGWGDESEGPPRTWWVGATGGQGRREAGLPRETRRHCLWLGLPSLLVRVAAHSRRVLYPVLCPWLTLALCVHTLPTRTQPPRHVCSSSSGMLAAFSHSIRRSDLPCRRMGTDSR